VKSYSTLTLSNFKLSMLQDNLLKIVLKNMDEFYFRNKLIMSFKITTLFLLCIKYLYVNYKKHDIIVSKLKWRNSPMLQMNFVKVKYIENLPIQEILILKINLQKNASLY
jgi:hypothetical protein